MALAREGASLLANGIQSLTPELAHVAAVLQARFNARTEANLYCSRAHKRAFRSHFDSHHVFALHIAGEKTWNVYEARAEEPINHARFKLPMDETVRRRGAVREQFRMRPGDLLYIPRGIYHDALANSESSIHISFSVMGVIGWDLLQLLTDQALDDAFVRRTLPRYEEGEAALLAHLEALRGRLDGILGSERFVQALRRYQQGISEGPGEVHLPIRGDSSKD